MSQDISVEDLQNENDALKNAVNELKQQNLLLNEQLICLDHYAKIYARECGKLHLIYSLASHLLFVH